MKIMKKLKKVVVGAIALTFACSLVLPGVKALATEDSSANSSTDSSSESSSGGSGGIDTSKDGTLTVEYIYKEAGEGEAFPTPGVVAHIYKIADIDSNGNFTVLSPFDNAIDTDALKNVYSIENQSQWDSIITELNKYIKANDVADTATVTADSNGEAAVGTVSVGLYLGISDPLKMDGKLYNYFPFLTMVPALPVNDDGTPSNGFTWADANYNVVVSPKREVSNIDDPAVYKVYKQWSGDDADSRPSSITVKIYCDGAEYETVELSNSNNWQYSWTYERGHMFSVEEVLADDTYTASITQNENSFIIVNTKNPDNPDSPNNPDNPDNPDKPDKKHPKKVDDNPPKDNPDQPDDSTGGDDGGDDTTPVNDDDSNPDLPDVLGAVRDLIGELPEVLGARRLPQTGQLWWPIPVLAIIGIVLVGLGIRSEKRRKAQK